MTKVLNTDKREIGIDILKILSMTFVTVIHFVGYTEILELDTLSTFNKAIVSSLFALSSAAVNIFVLITGYFMANKKFTKDRVFSLWSKVFITAILMLIIGVLVGGKITLINIIKSIFPISTFHYWFIQTYILLLFVSPLLNAFLSSISTKTHGIISLVGGLVISVLFVSNPFCSESIYIGHDRSIVWFSYLYILGAYMRLPSFKKIPKLLFGIGALFSFLVIFFVRYFDFSVQKNIILTENNSFFPLVLTVCLFALIQDVKVHNNLIKRIIISLSACSLFVYLIQEHEVTRGVLWNSIENLNTKNSELAILYLICVIIVLWIAAFLMNQLYSFSNQLVGKKR